MPNSTTGKVPEVISSAEYYELLRVETGDWDTPAASILIAKARSIQAFQALHTTGSDIWNVTDQINQLESLGASKLLVTEFRNRVKQVNDLISV